ncbi:MAG: glycosyltransferase family 1 protein [Sulfurimicrobium sp.]|nr:glycosyltransferase family 1 protein [Sulfurimicrobium sp.]MDP1703536.1 glycosyltransferase family 1 protein [Sulfurimicrobium sp.]MDP2200050.1 glycosyltransferase family 1 protein [Sulfurimicrobium sp.]MDP3686108.1 glycosyltransferase family 1 protein [Sulfurimicrobium sp.]MDZ7656168.1 glycosyltransferase family 1 protein [Sulfurimicrobium sp.]
MKEITKLAFDSSRTSPTLRVAVVTETYPPEVNGVAMTAQRMVQGLISRCHQVQLIRPRQSQEDRGFSSASFDEVLVQGIPVPRYRDLKMGLPARAKLLALWKQRRPHLVQVVTEGPLGWSAIAAAKQLHLPVISDFHTNFHSYSKYYGAPLLGKAIGMYLRWLHNRAHCTLVPTDAMRHELSGMGFRNLQVLSRGVDTQLFHPSCWSRLLRQSWGVGDHRLVALYVGRIAAEKNLPLLIEAFRRMQTTRPNMKLVMVGDGPERAKLQAMHPDLIFAGMRVGEDLADHYASADLFLFPSITETFGNVVLEAMASGLPVVAYDCAAAREHIRHGENGLRAAFDDAHAFVSQAQRLVASVEDARRMGRNARMTAEKIDWNQVHDRFEMLISNTVQQWERCHDRKARLSFVPDL